MAYLQRANRAVLEMPGQGTWSNETTTALSRLRVLWILLPVLIILTPLGLLAPGTAWGEWGADELAQRGLAFVPKGFASLQGLWGAPMKDYNLPALGNANLGYILSAIVGVALIALVAWLLTTALTVRQAPGKEQS